MRRLLSPLKAPDSIETSLLDSIIPKRWKGVKEEMNGEERPVKTEDERVEILLP